MAREKFHLEYIFERVSTDSLWKEISTRAGLGDWFADKVTGKGNNFVFIWGESESERMELVHLIPQKLIRFNYLNYPDNYIEFSINTVELTGVRALEVTDFAESSDIQTAIELWDEQVARMHRRLGAE